MSNEFLSQEEIDALLKGSPDEVEVFQEEVQEDEIISDMEKDILGEIGNISMGSASTALSQIINQQVTITTPVVDITTIGNLRKEFKVPNIVLEVEYTSGIVGRNVLVMKTIDASVIANLMMGGDGTVKEAELSEIEISAVQEAMNQMIGSAATSMATMLSKGINISPPTSRIWNENTEPICFDITDDEPIIKVSFRMTIGSLVDSEIMQLIPIKTAKNMISIMMGTEEDIEIDYNINTKDDNKRESSQEVRKIQEKDIEKLNEVVEVQRAEFTPLKEEAVYQSNRNIDLILDVPLEISVVLGRTKKTIKEVLSLGVGSLVELDKLAEEPVEILVNGKKVAYGEVVVVDESFGVRITSIVSNAERVKSLKE